MSRRITLKAIANAAKVSVATASRALNKTGSVSPAVERRVKAAALKLEARSAGQRRTTQMLCFLLANRPMLHPFHAQVLMGAQAMAAEHGAHILFHPCQYSADVAVTDIRLPVLLEPRGMIDGYIVGGMNTPNLLALLREAEVPFAVLGNNVLGEWKPEQCDVIWMDDAGGGHELTRHLLGLGHRRIAFLGSRRFASIRMQQGCCRAMAEAGLEPVLLESDSLDERESGFLAAKRLFSQGGGVTAILCYSDPAAHGVLEAANGCGLRVPDDLSIAGFGDRPEASAMHPALTTVWGYPDQVGRRLAEMVLQRIAHPTAPPRSAVLPTRLIRRESCGRAPVAAAAHSSAGTP